MLGLALAVAAAAATCHGEPTCPPFLPPTAEGMRIVHVIENTQLPDPGANNLRLCVKDGKVCSFYHERKGIGITITIPIGKRHQ
jgi:hypothetical protein